VSSIAPHIDACLASLGQDAFAPRFCDFAETLAVDQVMIFAIDDDRARCLLSRHFGHAALGESLAASYLDDWWRRDPLLAELASLPAGETRLRRLSEIENRMPEDYRWIFFAAPGLGSKTTVLARGSTLRLFVSFYSAADDRDAPEPALARIAGRLALMHFERRIERDAHAPLAVLSARERTVCLGILAGRTADAIARDLNLAPSTVVTYRKRAYDKLGVASRADLFAVCQITSSPREIGPRPAVAATQVA